MLDFTSHILTVLPSLILANILHMLVVKWNILPFLNKPISSSLFGPNKTWRGFILVPVFNILFLLLINSLLNLNLSNVIPLGFFLGLAYVAFELPNSFIKRKSNIKAGETSANKNYFFMLIDKMDSAFGVALIYYLLSSITITEAVVLMFVCSLTHIVMSLILVFTKIKASF
jgi:CDP-diacylglycerol--serine O-phosphatidyltransferase